MFNYEHIFLAVLITALGQIGHLGLVKIPSMQEKAAAVNIPFKMGEWLSSDWTRIVAIFSLSLAIEMVIQLFNGTQPKAEIWKFAFYGVWGFMLSSIVQKKYSSYEKKVMKFIDLKSNIADDVTERVNNSSTGAVVVSQAQIEEIKPTNE